MGKSIKIGKNNVNILLNNLVIRCLEFLVDSEESACLCVCMSTCLCVWLPACLCDCVYMPSCTCVWLQADDRRSTRSRFKCQVCRLQFASIDVSFSQFCVHSHHRLFLFTCGRCYFLFSCLFHFFHFCHFIYETDISCSYSVLQIDVLLLRPDSPRDFGTI